MANRDEKGRFVRGCKPGPGRPSRDVEEDYLKIMRSVVTPERWREICERAYRDAKKGDTSARRFLADYIVGKPVERIEADVTQLAMTLDDWKRMAEERRNEVEAN